MYVRCVPNRKNIKYLYYVQGYRDHKNKVKQKTIEKIGDWEDLIKKYDDPIKHFNDLAEERAIELGLNDDIEKTLEIDLRQFLDSDFKTNNLGYTFLKSIYKELDLRSVFKRTQKDLAIKYNLNSIFELLVYSRILFPGSKKETFENKDTFFENYTFSLTDIYRSLDHFSKLKDEILTNIWENTKDKYKRDTSVSYYDCTNYYFEISYNDEDLIDEEGNIIEKKYRKKGMCKENRKTPIIGLGLLMDNNGIPLSYDLYPGNESEKIQLRPTLKKTKATFGLDRTIIVADRGLNTSDNTVFIANKNDDKRTNHDGYVYGQSILGADKEFKEYVLNQNNYIYDNMYDENGKQIFYELVTKDEDGKVINKTKEPAIFKHKSRVIAKKVQIKKDGKRNVKYEIYQKQMVYYSRKFADRQKKLRDIHISKAEDLIKNPGKYTRATSYGASKYVNNIKFNPETGEINEETNLSLNTEIIKEEAKFDGYYSIVTSEKNLSDVEIRKIYKGLWKIEETFKITKSNLKTRPVYVWTTESIEAHFLTCFVALTIIRLLEKNVNNKYSTTRLITSLQKLEAAHLKHDIYHILYRDDVIITLEEKFNLNFSKKFVNIKNIKNITT